MQPCTTSKLSHELEPPPSACVDAVIRNLCSAVDEQSEAIVALTEALEPVLQPTTQSQDEVEPALDPPDCPLAERLTNLLYRIQHHTARLIVVRRLLSDLQSPV